MLKRILMSLAVAMWLAMPAAKVRAEAPHVEAGSHAEESHDSHAADAHGEDHAKPPLLPDLHDSQTYYSALWVVIIFVVLLAVLYPTAWKNILAGLKAREDRIRKDIADAEAARARAEATLKDYTAQLATAEAKVREMIAKAGAEGERVAAGIRTHAQQEAEEIKERAARDIEAAKNSAIGEIYSKTADLATNIAEKILRKNLNADDQRELVNRSLEQLQGLNKN
jgi:F-type H+-transporting ATPase subunit b